MKTIHVIVEGRVQGVFFRDYTKRQAFDLRLKGWVRNLPNGTVEAVVNGKNSDIQSMIEWFHTGSPLSSIYAVNVEEVILTEKLKGFEIRY